jgi:hypothetical protein
MVVANAHRVTDDSGEGFAVRLYRQGRPAGPLAAFSDAPVSFCAGFNKLEKTMRALCVRRLLLYPRIRAAVADDLEAEPAEVDDWTCPLSDAQRAILEAVSATVRSLLRDIARTNRVDMCALRVPACLPACLPVPLFFFCGDGLLDALQTYTQICTSSIHTTAPTCCPRPAARASRATSARPCAASSTRRGTPYRGARASACST